jgi:hypothetical protein
VDVEEPSATVTGVETNLEERDEPLLQPQAVNPHHVVNNDNGGGDNLEEDVGDIDEAPADDIVIQRNEARLPEVRRSGRTNKGVPPVRFRTNAVVAVPAISRSTRRTPIEKDMGGFCNFCEVSNERKTC